jgi:hypothetical protein
MRAEVQWIEASLWWVVCDEDNNLWEVVTTSADQMLLVRYVEDRAIGAVLLRRGEATEIVLCAPGDEVVGFDCGLTYYLDEEKGWI